MSTAHLPTDSKARKETPIASGVLDYFPDALAAIAQVSWRGNEKHNPGEPLHWAREKSTDHSDCLIRHFLERDGKDEDGDYHAAKMAWRALAILQLVIERDRATPIDDRLFKGLLEEPNISENWGRYRVEKILRTEAPAREIKEGDVYEINHTTGKATFKYSEKARDNFLKSLEADRAGGSKSRRGRKRATAKYSASRSASRSAKS